MSKHIALALVAIVAATSLAVAQDNPGAKSPAPPAASDKPDVAPTAPQREGATPERQGQPANANDRTPSPKANDEKATVREDRERDPKAAEADSKSNSSVDKNPKPDTADRKEDAQKNQPAKADRQDKDGKATRAESNREGSANPKAMLSDAPTEVKTKVKSSFRAKRVEPARDLNISVDVGVAVPRSVKLYTVPEDVVVLLPRYRDYRYFYIDDNRICIVDPDTYEIVEIIVLV